MSAVRPEEVHHGQLSKHVRDSRGDGYKAEEEESGAAVGMLLKQWYRKSRIAGIGNERTRNCKNDCRGLDGKQNEW
jgi:hypothetical protein